MARGRGVEPQPETPAAFAADDPFRLQFGEEPPDRFPREPDHLGQVGMGQPDRDPGLLAARFAVELRESAEQVQEPGAGARVGQHVAAAMGDLQPREEGGDVRAQLWIGTWDRRASCAAGRTCAAPSVTGRAVMTQRRPGRSAPSPNRSPVPSR